MSGRLNAALLLGLSCMLAGCFEQPDASGETGDDCTPGAAGCPCADGVCLQGLECREIGCVNPECVEGTLDCPCLPAGGCDAGLVCAAGFCKMPPPAATGTESGATQGPGDASVSQSGASIDDSAGDGMTSGPGPTTTLSGATGDEGPPPECDGDNLCPALGEICVDGMCQPSGPYGPCVLGCTQEGTCAYEMAMTAEVCSAQCVRDCPALPGLPATVCVDDHCFLPCDGSPGSCPLPMQCVMATFTDPLVCMWPMPK